MSKSTRLQNQKINLTKEFIIMIPIEYIFN